MTTPSLSVEPLISLEPRSIDEAPVSETMVVKNWRGRFLTGFAKGSGLPA
jgi:hypothetical protein